MLLWWKCKIVGKDHGPVKFQEGDIIFAKNADDSIVLFDGNKVAYLPKVKFKTIKLLSWLGREKTAIVERAYQLKIKPALLSNTSGNPNPIAGQDPGEPAQPGAWERSAGS